MNIPCRDLSEHHGMLGQVFDPGEDLTGNPWLGFSDEELAFFEEHGYVKGGRVLTETQLDCLRGELENFFDPEHSGRDLWYEYQRNEATAANQVLFHALGAWRIAPGFHDLLWHFPWLGRASQLLGSGVRFWHDQLFVKPAHDGGVVAWHQDYSYWTRTQPMGHLTCWIGLDDSTLDNGCVHYVPGSHRWNLLPVTGLVPAGSSPTPPPHQGVVDYVKVSRNPACSHLATMPRCVTLPLSLRTSHTVAARVQAGAPPPGAAWMSSLAPPECRGDCPVTPGSLEAPMTSTVGTWRWQE